MPLAELPRIRPVDEHLERVVVRLLCHKVIVDQHLALRLAQLVAEVLAVRRVLLLVVRIIDRFGLLGGSHGRRGYGLVRRRSGRGDPYWHNAALLLGLLRRSAAWCGPLGARRGGVLLTA